MRLIDDHAAYRQLESQVQDVGIVTGVVLELQFGLNWSGLSHYLGDVFGAPLALETLVAFFLESTFLGLWIFGWGRLKEHGARRRPSMLVSPHARQPASAAWNRSVWNSPR